MLIRIQRLLNEAVMGFLALLSLFVGLAPAVFEEGPTLSAWFSVTEIGVVALFAVEYFVGLVLADSRRAYLVNPWRILDAAIVAIALLALVPSVSDALRSSPALRLVRLGRFALLGARSGLRLRAPVQQGQRPASQAPTELEVHALDPETPGRFTAIDWPAALERIASAEPDWLFISGVDPDRLGPIAGALAVPELALRKVFSASFPRLDRFERLTAMFAWYPRPDADTGRVLRTPVLLVGTAQNVVVLTRERTDLIERVQDRFGDLDNAVPGMVRATFALVAEILAAYTRSVEGLEGSVIDLEASESSLGDNTFLARSFTLRADIGRVRANLKHLNGVVQNLTTERIAMHGFEAAHRELFTLLADDAGDLYATVDDLRETLAAVVDLRLNVSSFQMNRVMRLLALLTALALIPATVGGLLGMNVLGSPWPATFGQVTFGVAAGMALSLYVFAVKGWLR